jgi:hypothetical protein
MVTSSRFKGMHMMGMLEHLETSEVVTIATATSQGRLINTPVGAVVVEDAGYLRSQKGARGKWYRRSIRTRDGFVLDGTVRYPVTFDHVTDVETIRRVDEATYRKYGGALRSLLLWPLLRSTRSYVVRITPAA